MDGELLRLIDSIHRDKAIDKELVFESIEAGLHSAALRHLGASNELVIRIDRETGEITAVDGEEEINPEELGRIAAQTTRQVIIQKIREAERDVVFDDFADRRGAITNGTVSRVEGSTIIVNLGRVEGVLPRYEQIQGETYRTGDRIRALVQDVKKAGSKVKIILSRTHPDLVKRLFEIEVPEISDGVVEIKALAREAGHRTKICVISHDAKIDCVGACVGVRGARIRNIVEELNGEKIDIIRWTEQPDVMIQNALRPAEISSIELNNTRQRAIVIVEEDQLSLAIGRKGQNVRLASKLSGWEIDIMSARQAEVREKVSVRKLGAIPGITQEQVQDLFDFGFRNFRDIAGTEPETLTQIESIDETAAEKIVDYAKENLDIERDLDKRLVAEIEQGEAPEDSTAVEDIRRGDTEAPGVPAGEDQPQAPAPETLAEETPAAAVPVEPAPTVAPAPVEPTGQVGGVPVQPVPVPPAEPVTDEPAEPPATTPAEPVGEVPATPAPVPTQPAVSPDAGVETTEKKAEPGDDETSSDGAVS
ncbi:MAG: transcription termination factor NusA [Planctomycetota bacterium]